MKDFKKNYIKKMPVEFNHFDQPINWYFFSPLKFSNLVTVLVLVYTVRSSVLLNFISIRTLTTQELTIFSGTSASCPQNLYNIFIVKQTDRTHTHQVNITIHLKTTAALIYLSFCQSDQPGQFCRRKEDS